MTAGGQCWELPMLERRTSGIDSGLWPTPTCPNGGRSVAHVTDWRSERTAYTATGKKVQVDLAQAVKRWPTPTVCGNYNRKGLSERSGDGLATAVMKRPTPRASENDQGRKADAMMDGISSWKSHGRGATLTTAVKRWTTPTAHNVKEGGFPAEYERNTPTLAAQDGGSLNPTWVEWLMGWPLGWTDLKLLATDKSPCAQPQRGKF
jgi:hypothetical protein